MISGLGPLLYWLTNYAFDFMFYIGTAMMVLPPLAFIPHTQLTGSDIPSAGCVGWVFKEHYSDDIESAGLTTVLEVALQVLRLLPSQSYSRGMTKILQLAQENALCRRGGIELQSRCHAADAKAHLSLWECCLQRVYACICEFKTHPRPPPYVHGAQASGKHEDTDVLREEGLVNGLVSGDVVVATDARPFVIVHRLYKAYGYTDTNSVLQFQRYVGYCPQRDGLLDMLTATETLLLFGRLKGVPMSAEYLNVLLDIFHLGEFAEQLVCTMSAGNRRKLSLCVAMMGVPRLLLLDEPYAGIGTTARKRIVSYMSALQRTTKFSILLSSHSMADVEFLCNRIAILGEGRLQCLGSLAHLKEKFGKGYTITVKTYPDRKQDFFYHKEVAADVTKNFKEAELVHSYEGQLEFRMSRVHMLWSEMFMRMAKIKKKFKLQDFFITDTSLEQIFLSVTRKEASEAAAAAAVQSPVGRTVALATTLGI
ncbi:hypothetical protein V5799_030770 [Amblyomma americanum]|uniref:ABC transporter domain-containing protein n=1 Tax=Amblyomma americanum TaxID=6943 RepID=A0AAQ4EM82_AMBAM